MSLPKLHVAVLMGGWSNERPVSLMSGEGVAKALEERGHGQDDGQSSAHGISGRHYPRILLNCLSDSPLSDAGWAAIRTGRETGDRV